MSRTCSPSLFQSSSVRKQFKTTIQEGSVLRGKFEIFTLSTITTLAAQRQLFDCIRADKAIPTAVMDAKDCTGRKISLLNYSSDSAALSNKQQLPAFAALSRSRESSTSCASTPPGLSPDFASPSLTPLTPSSNTFEHSKHSHPAPAHQYYFANRSCGKMDDQHASMYPPIPDLTGALPSAYSMPPQMPTQMPAQMPPQPVQQIFRASNSPSSEPSRVSTVSATSNSKAQAKKNQYPCPMAKQVGCTDFFTTSGHAARHAKKHTGKKDAFCPECNKAFTRKDNMEQHRRTHQNGRGASRSNNGEEAKVKKPAKQPVKKPGIKAEQQQLEAAVEQQLAEQHQQQQQQQQLMPVPLVAQVAQAAQAQAVQQQALEEAMMLPPGGPYFLNQVDSGPIPSLPMAMPDLNPRPSPQRNNFATSLDYIPPVPVAPMINDPDALHYSYPSPGLSNGLNSLALAASEHRRWSEEKSQSQSPTQETP